MCNYNIRKRKKNRPEKYLSNALPQKKTINNKHKSTDPRSSDNASQEKYKNIYIYDCHIQTAENQIKRKS